MKSNKTLLYLFLILFSLSYKAQIPEEIQWKHLEKVYAKDSTQLVLKLNTKALNGTYKIPFDDGSYALYKIEKGMIYGDAFWYSAANNLEAKLKYKNGVRDGLKENYDRNGNVWLRQNYKLGKQDGKSEMLSDGKLANDSNYKLGKKEGLQKVYLNGKLISEINYKEGLKDGFSKTYDSNVNLITEINYKNDLRNGLTAMYANAKKTMDFEYKNGEKHGISHMYDPNGKLIFTHYYSHGNRVTAAEYEKENN